MPIGLTDYVKPKNDAFTGIVQASQVLGGGGDGTLPDACVAESNTTQHASAIVAASTAVRDGDFGSNGLCTRTSAGNYANRSVAAANDAIGVANGDGVSGNPTLTLATKIRTRNHLVYVETPADTDVFPVAFVGDAVTMVKVWGQTDTGTVDFNIEERATTSPGSSGTDTLTADLQSTSSGANSSSFSNSSIAADSWLVFVASATASSPTKLWVAFEYTIDAS